MDAIIGKGEREVPVRWSGDGQPNVCHCGFHVAIQHVVLRGDACVLAAVPGGASRLSPGQCKPIRAAAAAAGPLGRDVPVNESCLPSSLPLKN
ncbi:hypothetical protein EYF80_039752 [Liparis tanakae]|uniref:Uncharacterized protein n=1 Tax=Liparis tanakae TaxID=230148 RepID=A0A4Z2GBI1_9TELE|nr:hypothetical protein EYF80_039752 [Liparis tanakae]